MSVQHSRRGVVIAGLGAALAVSQRASAFQGAVQGGGGIAGGGSITSAEGVTANFSVFASKFTLDSESDPLFFGSISLTDSNGISLSTSEISSYGPVEGNELARTISGTVIIDEKTVPFLIEIVTSDAEGVGADTFSLNASPDPATPTSTSGDIAYSISGTLETGDIQLLTFEFEG